MGNLIEFSMSNNQLSGEIPPEIGSLVRLERLWLANNRLSGEIPPELGNLTYLETLWLAGNQLSGEIPLELSNLAYLEILRLADNELSGCVPEVWIKVADNDLDSLALPLCAFTPNPDRAALVALYDATGGPNWVDSTNWLSDLPVADWFGVAADADDGRVIGLGLPDNQLSGQIPPEIGSLDKLVSLSLTGNQLSGEIPPRQLGQPEAAGPPA